MVNSKYDELEQSLGYTFQDREKLDIALTHKSYSNEMMCNVRESYERYEFLGDAVLEFLTSIYLFERYPEKTEGELTKLRASLVCEFTLSKIARELKFGEYGYFSKGERQTGGANRDSILCDMFESVLGAIYLDGGMEEADKYVKKFLLTDIEHKQLFYDAKTRLLEYSQKNHRAVEYRLTDTIGPEHNKEYYVELFIDGVSVSKGVGHSKKSAEQMAAYNGLKTINEY